MSIRIYKYIYICFGRCFRSSSGARDCNHSIW